MMLSEQTLPFAYKLDSWLPQAKNRISSMQ